MHQLHTEITIDASAERVWLILTDFAAYPEWNPFIREIHGSAEVGSDLKAVIQPSGGKVMTFRPRVLVAEPSREVQWLGRLLVPGLFDGEHRFAMRPNSGDGVDFEQSEQFRGLLVPVFRGSLDSDTKRGFIEMNEALKKRAEKGSAPSPPHRAAP